MAPTSGTPNHPVMATLPKKDAKSEFGAITPWLNFFTIDVTTK